MSGDQETGRALVTVEQGDLLPPGPPPHATLIATDGRRVVLQRQPDGSLSMIIHGREPVVLDRFQTAAFVAAVAALGDPR
ncbi:hypothetical protein [Falsiroseomonas tokyonensis]|uniref:Uncharacterized protein n=1 Tax=Falsiroseomonas tokyonensis TaxID=430521 RepID=A0ABV7C185_9PROT|nr:hypothetical protein [Falsiroseomonas tokyonensis]MBU8540225.1 hypothetical protein [Falsiroseomonas tokyonensis]